MGVFEDPKAAKAPDPRPNALLAPAVGEAREVVDGDMALKGFLLLWEEVSVVRLPRENPRAGWSLLGGPPFVEVERESLLVLGKSQLVLRLVKRKQKNVLGTATP